MAKKQQPAAPAEAETGKVEIRVSRIVTIGKLAFRPDRKYRVKPDIREAIRAEGALVE